MPKVIDTRMDRAKKLLERLERGPSLGSDDIGKEKYTPEDAMESFRIWARSWIIDELKDLVPELRKLEKDKAKGAA